VLVRAIADWGSGQELRRDHERREDIQKCEGTLVHKMRRVCQLYLVELSGGNLYTLRTYVPLSTCSD